MTFRRYAATDQVAGAGSGVAAASRKRAAVQRLAAQLVVSRLFFEPPTQILVLPDPVLDFLALSRQLDVFLVEKLLQPLNSLGVISQKRTENLLQLFDQL